MISECTVISICDNMEAQDWSGIDRRTKHHITRHKAETVKPFEIKCIKIIFLSIPPVWDRFKCLMNRSIRKKAKISAVISTILTKTAIEKSEIHNL